MHELSTFIVSLLVIIFILTVAYKFCNKVVEPHIKNKGLGAAIVIALIMFMCYLADRAGF